MSSVNSQPISMIQGSVQLAPVKIIIEYKYNSAYGLTPVDVLIYGIDKTGHNLIATCSLSVSTGYTAGEIASQIIVGIPVQHYPYIFLSYTPVTGFKIVGQPIISVEAVEIPDIMPTTVYTAALLS